MFKVVYHAFSLIRKTHSVQCSYRRSKDKVWKIEKKREIVQHEYKLESQYEAFFLDFFS